MINYANSIHTGLNLVQLLLILLSLHSAIYYIFHCLFSKISKKRLFDSREVSKYLWSS